MEEIDLNSLTHAEAIEKLKRIKEKIAKDMLSVDCSVVFDYSYAQDVLSEEFGIEQGWDG